MRFHVPALLVLALAPSMSAGQSPTSLELISLGGLHQTLGPAELEQLAGEDVTVVEDGVNVSYRGPSVRALASLAGAPSGRGLRGPAMTLVLLAEGSDGYAVGFMLSELDEQFGARAAIVALAREGEPLGAGDGPLRVVVPDDDFHARWVRGVVRLRIVDAAGGPDGAGAR